MVRLGSFVLIVLVFTLNCTHKHGTFSFFAADQSELSYTENILYQPDQFKKYKTIPLFEEDDTIWFAYKPASPQWRQLYGIALYKKSLGYLEIDLRNTQLLKQKGYLVDYYKDLEPGDYRLKIAFQNQTIDQIDFAIIPDSDAANIDYDTELSLRDTESEPGDNPDKETPDELVAISR